LPNVGEADLDMNHNTLFFPDRRAGSIVEAGDLLLVVVMSSKRDRAHAALTILFTAGRQYEEPNYFMTRGVALVRELWEKILSRTLTPLDLHNFLQALLGEWYGDKWGTWHVSYVFWQKQLWKRMVLRDFSSAFAANRGKGMGLGERLAAMIERESDPANDPRYDDIGELAYAAASWARRVEILMISMPRVRMPPLRTLHRALAAVGPFDPEAPADRHRRGEVYVIYNQIAAPMESLEAFGRPDNDYSPLQVEEFRLAASHPRWARLDAEQKLYHADFNDLVHFWKVKVAGWRVPSMLFNNVKATEERFIAADKRQPLETDEATLEPLWDRRAPISLYLATTTPDNGLVIERPASKTVALSEQSPEIVALFRDPTGPDRAVLSGHYSTAIVDKAHTEDELWIQQGFYMTAFDPEAYLQALGPTTPFINLLQIAGERTERFTNDHLYPQKSVFGYLNNFVDLINKALTLEMTLNGPPGHTVLGLTLLAALQPESDPEVLDRLAERLVSREGREELALVARIASLKPTPLVVLKEAAPGGPIS
jgi:hypothetical protein